MIRCAGQFRAVGCLVALAAAFWAAPGQGAVELTGVPSRGFSDVGSDHWAYDYISYCQAEGIVQGYPDGSYRPAVEVTRDQMAVYVARAFDLSLEWPDEESALAVKPFDG